MTHEEKELMRPLPDQQVAIDKLVKVPARLCGDSMGVGKTVTGIGLDLEQRKLDPSIDDLPTLIVAEKIGLDVWNYHLKAMGIPAEEILLVDPAARDEFVSALEYEAKYQASKVKTPPQHVYYVVHWDVLNKIPALTERRTKTSKFAKVEFAHLIADEVHLAKNRKALRTLAFKRITARYKTGLSGTPADDKPWDIWSVLHWLYPKKYRSYWKFWDDYIQWVNVSEWDDWAEWLKKGWGTYEDFRAHPKHCEPGSGYRIAVGVKNMDKLHREMDPFYIRRTLLEVDPNMPEKVHVDPPITVKMTGKMRKEYDRMRDTAMALIGPDADFTLLAPKTIAVLTRLQQMALATLAPEWEVTINDYGDEEYDLPKIVLTKPSPKLDAVMNLVTTHEEEPFVIFTQFRGMADLVEEECQRLKIPVSKITGEVHSKDRRTEIVQEFQDGKTRVFVGTIAAAGRTITLTRARIVIFIDRSWNPNKNAQAEDRVWRRTQKNAVRVYHIESENSVDQIRLVRITQKGQWTEAINNPGKFR